MQYTKIFCGSSVGSEVLNFSGTATNLVNMVTRVNLLLAQMWFAIEFSKLFSLQLIYVCVCLYIYIYIYMYLYSLWMIRLLVLHSNEFLVVLNHLALLILLLILLMSFIKSYAEGAPFHILGDSPEYKRVI